MSFCLLIGWLVCQQGHVRTTEQISMKLVWRMSLGPEQILITFGADTDKGTDQGEQKQCFSELPINFSAHNAYY